MDNSENKIIAIIDYRLNNLNSVKNCLRKMNHDFSIITSEENFIDATHYILPGVGSFEQGMKNLKDRGLIELLNQEVIQHKKPFLGICLGMQLIMEKGTEPIECEGLGWIKGTVEVINN